MRLCCSWARHLIPLFSNVAAQWPADKTVVTLGRLQALTFKSACKAWFKKSALGNWSWKQSDMYKYTKCEAFVSMNSTTFEPNSRSSVKPIARTTIRANYKNCKKCIAALPALNNWRLCIISELKSACAIHINVITIKQNNNLGALCFFSGGFAFVYEAQDMSSGKDYALKVRHKWTHWGHSPCCLIHVEPLSVCACSFFHSFTHLYKAWDGK